MSEEPITQLETFELGDGSGVMVCCAEDAQAIIAERDAKIAELEQRVEVATTECVQQYRWRLEDSECGRDEINDGVDMLLARLKAQPSGVVLPERMVWDGLRATACNIRGDAWNDCLDEVARLNQPTAGAGVVVGALVSALEGIVHDERVPNEVSQDYAALLIEARRLNPCRAQLS